MRNKEQFTQIEIEPGGSPAHRYLRQGFFANDQLAVHFIEETDLDYAAGGATAVLLTAAS